MNRNNLESKEAVKSIDEAKDRIKKMDIDKLVQNAQKAKQRRGY